MGAGASAALPPEYSGLTEEKKKDIHDKYAALITSGKTHEEAVELLKVPDSHTTPTAEEKIKVIPLTELTNACEAAIRQGKTPLVVDDSEDSKVDTFFSYQSSIIFDGKKMGLDKSMRKVPVGDIMEENRKKLVGAIQYGYPVVIALTKSVTDFATTFSDEACLKAEDQQGLVFKDGQQSYFPIEIFKNAGKGLLTEESMNRLFREEDKKDTCGLAMCRSPDTFHVIVTTNFSPEDFEEYLFENEWGLPKPIEQYQFIVVKPDEKV